MPADGSSGEQSGRAGLNAGAWQRPQPTHFISFRFEDVLPVAERLSSWVSVMALVCNDSILDAANVLRAESPEEMSYFARIAAGHVYEAAQFVATTARWPEISKLVAALDPEPRADWDALVTLWDSGTEHPMRPQLDRARNYVFHYPDLNKTGSKAVTKALERLATNETTIALGKSLGSYRFQFGDDIALNIISGVGGLEEQEAFRKFAEGLRELVLALQRCSEAVLATFFAGKGSFVPIDGSAPD
jgi:hypothetical protein